MTDKDKIEQMRETKKTSYLIALGDFSQDFLLEHAGKWEPGKALNMYDPANFALAWHVLNWWHGYIATTDDAEEEFPNVGKLMQGIWAQPLAIAQRSWLDRVLELALRANKIPFQEEAND